MKNNFLHLLLLSFVFIGSCALALSGAGGKLKVINFKREAKVFPALPVLAENSAFPVVSAQAALAIDLDSGVILYEKEPDKALLPASTTKIVTALVAMDYYPQEEILTVAKIKIDGQKMGLKEGEKISVNNLLYGLLVYSANDAAEVLAENFPGGREVFINAMNEKARQLHLDHSYFTNPAGLDSNGDHIVSTARDLIRVAEVAMQNSHFAEIVKTEKITVKSFDGKIAHKLFNINELVGKVDGVLGVKTGWTENARENLITYLERDGHRVMIAALASQDRFGETKELITWIFANYQWQEVKAP
jgi:D-alanyl-D-alanine carboxypeptidase